MDEPETVVAGGSQQQDQLRVIDLQPLNFKFTRGWHIKIPTCDSVSVLNESFVLFRFKISFGSFKWVVAKRFSECHEFSEALKKRYKGTDALPHFPIRFPGFLMDENFVEIRRLELEFYFQNLPKDLFTTTEVRSFLEYYSQNFEASGQELTEEEKTEVWMVKNTKPVYESKVGWLQDQLRDHKLVVLVFFRGGWCPYSKPHLETVSTALNEIHQAGGRVYGISAQGTDATKTFSEEIGNLIPLISDPSVSLALHFHTWVNKTNKASHPTGVLNQPAIIAIRGSLSEESSNKSNVQWASHYQTRKAISAEQNPKLEILLYWASNENNGQPNLSDAWNCAINPALQGKSGDIGGAATTGFFDADMWKVKENTMEGGSSEIKFGDEDELKAHLKNRQFQ